MTLSVYRSHTFHTPANHLPESAKPLLITPITPIKQYINNLYTNSYL